MAEPTPKTPQISEIPQTHIVQLSFFNSRTNSLETDCYGPCSEDEALIAVFKYNDEKRLASGARARPLHSLPLPSLKKTKL